MNSLKRWSELNRSSITAPTAYTSLTRQHSPFPHREDINGRFILWEGDISLLNADCVTNTTNERLSDSNTVSNRIVGRAGANLLEELKAIKGIIKRNIQQCLTTRNVTRNQFAFTNEAPVNFTSTFFLFQFADLERWKYQRDICLQLVI